MLNPQPALATAGMPDAALVEAIVQLAREASIEINVQDVADRPKGIRA
jgi:siroheme synthase (precorrin-2 oxidase/ferrochelatase)